MATMTSAQHFDPRDADVIQNPFPALAQLREHQPLHYSQAMAGWVITRYEDVRNSMRDPRYSSNRLRPFFAHMDPTRRQRLAALELERQTKQLQVEVSEAVIERLLREVAGEVRRIDEGRGVAGSEY